MVHYILLMHEESYSILFSVLAAEYRGNACYALSSSSLKRQKVMHKEMLQLQAQLAHLQCSKNRLNAWDALGGRNDHVIVWILAGKHTQVVQIVIQSLPFQS